MNILIGDKNMIRKIITIDKEKCNGCGLCARACHEGAIGIIEGKATLLREDYCDGLGDCLPACPTDAISFEEREALAYDEEAVHNSMSKLKNFPVQLKLAAPNAPFYKGSDLLIAADCAAYTYGNFHNDFMKNKVTLIGCPKLDGVDYSEKLYQIFATNNIQSVTLTRMEVPCCGGLENAVRKALVMSKKAIPLKVVTLSTEGRIIKQV